MLKSGLNQCLAQKMDVVGSPASASCLGDCQRNVCGIVFSAFQCIDHLTDYKQGGVAGIIVHIL